MTEKTALEDAIKPFDQRLAVLLSMAMFVLVVDTSLMNVSISAVVADLDTTVSSVQATIALEALVSAAFILIMSKVGDLIGRKRAYILGLLAYAIGAGGMVLAQSLTSVIIFWAILGGLGASLLLPALQALVHGNFVGKDQARVYALIGASAGIAAAVGPLIGGFVTSYISWRFGFALEVVVILIVLSGRNRLQDVPYSGPPGIDIGGGVLSVLGMGGVILGILVWQEGGEAVLGLVAVGVVSLIGLAYWIMRRSKLGKLPLIEPSMFKSGIFRLGISQQLLQQVALGGCMIVLPIFLQMVLEYDAMKAGLALAPLSLSMFAASVIAGKRTGKRRAGSIVGAGFAIIIVGLIWLILVVPDTDSGLDLAPSLVIIGLGFGLLLSQLNNYTLAPISDDLVSQAAGVNSASGQFGLSFGLAMSGAVMLAALSMLFTSMSDDSTVLLPDQKDQVATTLEDSAELMSNTQLEALLAVEPEATQDEIIRINTEARPESLQISLLVPLIAAVIGLVLSFRMLKQPEIEAPEGREAMALG